MQWNTPVTALPAVGAARAKALTRLGIVSAGDVLTHYPRDYEDRSLVTTISLAPADRPVCIRAMVAEPPRLSRIRKGLDLVKVRAVDSGGRLDLTFFNQSYIKDALRMGESYIFYGTAEGNGSRRSMTNPIFEAENAPRFTGRIMPVYPLTAGISNNLLAGLSRRVLDGCLDQTEEILPPALRQEYALPSARFALENIHFPEDWQALAAAKKRLSFQEFFLFSLGLSLLRQRRSDQTGQALPAVSPEDFLSLLPFRPTSAQHRAMEQICTDLSSGRPMNRLLQGDVGSGKTVVAAFAAWQAVRGGTQCAMMAPTEILARQHYKTLTDLLAPAGVRVGLLTGSVRAAEKKKLRAALLSGEIDLLVGTHALLTDGVTFRNLSLVITDEQHRFGVDQRSALAAKGTAVHALVMSATPIPRTLALIMYGDLEISILDELPPGRTPVETFLVGEDKRSRMLEFIRKQVLEGRQAYVICPMVEPGEEETTASLKAATAYAGDLQTRVFPELKVGLVHGRMKPKEKQAVMSAFSEGLIHVLVSTTVIEVGVDIPNANLIIIENAERFGLSQLHQLRGRVGRGTHKSYCVLVSDNRSPETRQRLRALCSTTDGFQIAEEDLKLRGPGDFFGSRQHGLPQLRVANFVEDIALLTQAQQAARSLLEKDPALKRPEHRLLLDQVRLLFEDDADRFN